MKRHAWLITYERGSIHHEHLLISTCSTGSRLHNEALESLRQQYPDDTICFTGAYDLGEEMDGDKS